MSPKDRVKTNIYKQLLEEEKIKNKRYLRASVSLFLIGVVSTTSYRSFIKEDLGGKINLQPTIIVNKNLAMDSEEKEKVDLDHFYSKDILSNKKIELDDDQVYGYDYQI